MKHLRLDFGHGGSDPGAIGYLLHEANVVLSLGTKTGNYILKNYEGVMVSYSRTSDVYVSLEQRTDAANKENADFLYSFHNNSHTTSTAHGFETFVHTNASSASIAYQNVIHGEVMQFLKKHNIYDRGKKRANLHMVRESKMPAVLAEYLFISNKRENYLLKNEAFLNDLAEATGKGIAKAMGLKEKVNPIVKEAVKVDDAKGHWAETALRKAEAKGILTRDKSTGNLRPDAALTRAEAATILDRLGLLK